MKKILSAWKYGYSYLFGDDLVSFYSFFTMIFAGCAWLFSYQDLSVAIPLTIVMLGYIANTVLFSWLKGNTEGTRREKIFSICYIVVFALLFIIGSIINVIIHFVMMVIIILVTVTCVFNREYDFPAWSQGISLCVPIILFAIYFAQIPWLPVVLKICIPVIYAICSPLIAYYEDCAAAQNIFELAYVITWSKEYEERMKKFEKSMKKEIVV